MLEENKDIDNLFKSVVEPYKMDPPEKVWTSLEAGLTKGQSSKKGYYGFKFLSITVAAVLLSFVGYQILAPTSYFNTNKTQDNPAQAVQEKVSNNSSSVDEKVEAANSTVATSNNNSTTSQNATSDNVSNSNSQSDYVQNNSSNAVQGSHTGNGVGEGSTQDDARNSNSSTTGSSNNNNATSSNSTAEPIPSSAKTASSESGTSSSDTGNDNEQAKTTKADESTKSVSDSTASINENSADDDAANLSLLSLKETKRHFSIDAFYSPDIFEGTFSANNSNATQSIATTNTEKFNLSFNTGAMLRYDVNDRWSISIGCTYSTLNYSTSLTTSYVVTAADSGNGSHQWNFPHSTNDTALSPNFNDPNFFNHYFPYSASTNTFYYNNNLGTIQLHGNPVLTPPASSDQAGDVVYFTTNTNLILQYINIPLTISYKISHRRFDYYLSGGASIDFLVNRQATVNIGDVYSETTNDITGLRNISYGYLFSAGVRYHLYKGVSVFIEPAFRGALTSITTTPSNNFYPYYFGLNTGVSVHF